MNQNQPIQTKSMAQCEVICRQLINISIIIAIIIITILSLLNNQNSSQVIQWCIIELSLIIYYLLQLIYEMRYQFYFIDVFFQNTYNIRGDTPWVSKFQMGDIYFLMNACYVQGLLFSASFYFRETEREIPGSGREYIGIRCDPCIKYDYETIPPQYHGPYLTQLANINITFFAFGCFYIFLWICTLRCRIEDHEEKYYNIQYNINLMTIKKKSQILCLLFTLYYICRAVHSILIYDQIINETLLCSIQAYIFYSLMMITVLISIIAIIQFKFNSENYINYKFITVNDIIDQTIYQNLYLLWYFWIMLITSFIYTCVGISYYQRDPQVDDIVNYQNYVLADLIIAQMVIIFFMLIKYVICYFCCLSNITSKILNNENLQIQFYDQQQQQGECTICLDQFNAIPVQTKNIIRINCLGQHVFHLACMKNWLKHNKTCPLCCTIINANLNI